MPRQCQQVAEASFFDSEIVMTLWHRTTQPGGAGTAPYVSVSPIRGIATRARLARGRSPREHTESCYASGPGILHGYYASRRPTRVTSTATLAVERISRARARPDSFMKVR